MPPLRGIDRGLDGNALKALEESGHGRRLAIVDASYDIPRWAQVVNYLGQTSAEALHGIASLVPIEEDSLTLMYPDIDDHSKLADDAYEAFLTVHGQLLKELGSKITIGSLYRKDAADLSELLQDADDAEEEEEGFYSVANNEAQDTLFVRTRDTLPYACATFIVGHSQQTE